MSAARQAMATTWCVVACALFVIVADTCVQPACAAPRPNVLLIVADDLGWADLGCYGADVHETPHLDRLAAQGVRFTTAYAPAPVCTPTRAALLTGKHPARLGLTTYRESVPHQPQDRKLIPPLVRADLPLAEVTLADRFREAGYRTAHVGKWHLGDAAYYPETQGYDIHIGGNHWGAPATHFFPFRGEPGKEEIRYVPGLANGRPGDYLADRLTDAALDVIRQAEQGPWFMTLWHYAVHAPIQAPAADVERFQRRLDKKLNHQNAVYAAMVKNLDDNVGRVLAELDRLKIASRTLVIFTSDNGGYLGPSRQQPGVMVTSNVPLRSGKGSLYEGGIRVPLLVRLPGDGAGAVCDAPVTLTDFYRTILDLAGLPEQIDDAQASDGQSLTELLKNPAAGIPQRTLYWHYPHYYPTTTPVSALRDGPWKLLEYLEDGRAELFHLADDPYETRDLAGDEPAHTTALRAKLQAWRHSVQAPMPTAGRATSTSGR